MFTHGLCADNIDKLDTQTGIYRNIGDYIGQSFGDVIVVHSSLLCVSIPNSLQFVTHVTCLYDQGNAAAKYCSVHVLMRKYFKDLSMSIETTAKSLEILVYLDGRLNQNVRLSRAN